MFVPERYFVRIIGEGTTANRKMKPGRIIRIQEVMVH